MPTLAKVVKQLNSEDSYYRQFIVEPVQEDPQKEGISEQKLCITHEIAGISGDAAQGFSGTILRLFGGGSGGIAFLNGKVSIGDNQTLAKVIDTFLENVAKRVTEIFVSTILYKLTYNEDTGELTIVNATDKQKNAWKIIKPRLELSNLIGCFIDSKQQSSTI